MSMKLIANTQTDHQNAKLTFRLTDIVTYRCAFATKNTSTTPTRLDKITIATIMHLQGQNASIKLVVHRQTNRQTDRQTDNTNIYMIYIYMVAAPIPIFFLND